MKNSLSVIRMALAAMTATALWLGAPWSAAIAQNTSMSRPGASQSPAWPSGVNEVMKMIKGGIPADILVSYINSSQLSFYLSADSLIALQHEGAPAPVLKAMLQRYGELKGQMGTAANPPAPAPVQYAGPQYASPPVQVPAQMPATPYYSYAAPQAAASYTYAAPSYPVYAPYYYYSPYYYPWYPFGWPAGFGFGIGRFGGGFRHMGGFGGHVGGAGHFGGGGRR